MSADWKITNLTEAESMANLSKEEKNALKKAWKAAQSKNYILTEENVQKLFEYLEEQLDNSCCDHTLHHTEQWLKENISQEMIESVIAEITDMGGYCDC
jgi:TRAP-type C4-dicarboxylate transport system substrate-binding protein